MLQTQSTYRNPLLQSLRQRIPLKRRVVADFEFGAVSASDSRFKSSCNRILEVHLDDCEFEVTDFCAEIGMSRTQLHRKMKDVFGCSTTEYIRKYRLKKAVHLLKNSDNNISEVAYLTGFNSRNYFSRSFRQVFGVSPRAYLDQLLAQPDNAIPYFI